MSDKKFLFEAIDAQRAELCSMADQIFDNPVFVQFLFSESVCI